MAYYAVHIAMAQEPLLLRLLTARGKNALCCPIPRLGKLRIPVMVLPADSPLPEIPFRLRSVLVPLDGSPDCEEILATLKELSSDETRYTLVHVAAPLHPVLRALGSDEAYEEDLVQQRRRAEEYLLRAVHRSVGKGCSCVGMVRVGLQPSREIIDACDEIGADMIALVTRGTSAVGRLLLGSVADKVLRTAKVPVLLQHVDVE